MKVKSYFVESQKLSAGSEMEERSIGVVHGWHCRWVLTEAVMP